MTKNKYIVFNRDDFEEFLAETFHFLNKDTLKLFDDHEIEDAVIIRRQDYFASPCLLTYASMIAMVAEHHPNKKTKSELQSIADYFHEQGVKAGDEAWKLPTP